jgi:GT2 family glycosyltransferase
VSPAAHGIGTLIAPVAVRVLDVGRPLNDFGLSCPRPRSDYRSLLAIVRLAEDPIGVATFPLEPGGRVTSASLAAGLHRQLGAELDEAYRQAGKRHPAPVAVVSGSAAVADTGPLPSLSVVVPTCCNPGRLERCVRSILKCDYADFEVIVVENRPRESNTARMLVERFPGERRLRYMEEPRPSASLARNAGLAGAEGEIVAFTDDDVVVDPLWLRASVEALLGARGVACVTGLILPLALESESQLVLEQFAGFGKGFRRATYRLPDARQENPLLPYAAGALGSGASIVMLTEIAREIGGFDPALGPATPAHGGEDLDLLVRVMRRGHSLTYEPRAIVWHEHPGARLRRQVYRYGVGLGAMLGKQLIAGPERRDFVRAVPAGLRYLRDPRSRKNGTKPTDYPRRLTWLERLGVAFGPVLYLLSALIARARRLAPTRTPSPRPVRIVRQIMVGGEPVTVSRWRETAPPRGRLALLGAGRQDAAGVPHGVLLGAALICAMAPALVLVDVPPAVRMPFVLALLCLVPGIAWMCALPGRCEAGLVIGIGMGVAGVVAQSMLWIGSWQPRPFLFALAAGCLLPVSRRLGERRVRVPRGLPTSAWACPPRRSGQLRPGTSG